MYCYNCGKEVEETVKFCPYCGTQLNGQATENKGEYEPIYQEPYVRENDAPSMGFALLSFFIPVVGLVLFIIWNKEYPLKAKSCLKGFIANVVLDIVMSCCVLSAAGGFVSQHDDEIDFYSEFNNAIVEVVPYE